MPLHPLIPPLLALLAGIAAARLWPLPWAWCLAGAGLAALLLVAQGWRRGRFATWLLVICFLLLGAGRYGQVASRPLPACHVRHQADGRPHQVEAVVVSAPEPGRWGRRVVLEALALDGRSACGRVRLALPRRTTPPPPGSRLRLLVRLKPFVSFANPACFDYAGFMAAKGLYVRAYAGRRSGLELLPGRERGPRVWLEGLRSRLGRVLERLKPGPGRGLVRALLLGQRGELPSRVREAFGGTGTAHLLAISGLHLGLVWGLAYLVLRYGLGLVPGLALRHALPKLAALGALVPCAAYAALAGGSTPTLRALVMAAALVAALWFDRPYRPAGGLALAGLGICLVWPRAPFTLSFQLSFTAVAVILLAAAPLARRLRGHGPAGRVLGGVLGWLALSAMVGAALWPLSVRAFHQLPLLSLPANALLIPLVAFLALPLGLLGAGVGLLWPDGGLALLELARLPAGYAVELARWLAGLPGAVRYVAGPDEVTVGLLYACALAWLALRGRWRLVLGGGLTLAVLVALLLGMRPPSPDGRLTAWVLDVGQGLSVVLRLPRGQVLVVDGGGLPGGGLDTGRQVVAPFLWHQGFSRLRLLVSSHPDHDHAGGLPFLARWFRPRAIWTNGEPPRPGAYGRLLAVARRRGIPVLTPASLPAEQELGGARLRLVWPRPDGPRPRRRNDRGLWLGVGLGRAWLWLPADVGPRVERRVAPLLPAAGEQVLVAPHHGGKDSCTPELLARLRPRLVVISAGCFNHLGLPRASTLERLAAFGVPVAATACRGCLRLSTAGRRWRIEPHLPIPRRCLAGDTPSCPPQRQKRRQ